MHLPTARIHPLCRLWLENRLHHTVQSSSRASHCRQATAGQTAVFGEGQGSDLRQSGGIWVPLEVWPRHLPYPATLAKGWWTGDHSTYVLSSHPLALSPPANTKLCGHCLGPTDLYALWSEPLNLKVPPFQSGDKTKWLLIAALGLFQKTKSILQIFSRGMWYDLRI